MYKLCGQKSKFCVQIFFLKNVCLSTKFDLRLKKKTQKIVWALSKILGHIFVVAIKKMLIIQFPYMEYV